MKTHLVSHIPHCDEHGECVRSDRYDAYACLTCDEWAEKGCSDPKCSFCSNRPEKPSLATDPKWDTGEDEKEILRKLTKALRLVLRAQYQPATGLAEAETLLDEVEAKLGPEQAVEIVQPIGNCDGSKLYAYDSSKPDGRGVKLAYICAGCRACS